MPRDSLKRNIEDKAEGRGFLSGTSKRKTAITTERITSINPQGNTIIFPDYQLRVLTE